MPSWLNQQIFPQIGVSPFQSLASSKCLSYLGLRLYVVLLITSIDICGILLFYYKNLWKQFRLGKQIVLDDAF